MVLHVGTPKTGTTYLQDVLWRNRILLRERDVLVPGDVPDAAFLAALDLTHSGWGGEPHPRSPGRWHALVEETRPYPGSVVISHEMFSGATAEHAQIVVEAFAPAPVEIVITARDLMRQVPAEWQENIKHGRVKTFEEFWQLLSDPAREHEAARWFYQAQDVPGIVDRWASAVPADRVRVVTVPPSGADPQLLWQRFAEACGLDDSGFDLDVHDGNQSLDTVTTALLRRVNVQLLDDPLRIDQRDDLLKGVLAHRVLAPMTSRDARIRLPADIAHELHEQAVDWRTRLEKSGCTVIGDIDELVPPEPGPAAADGSEPAPDDVPPAAVLKVAAGSIGRLLHELGAERDEARRVRAELADAGDAFAVLDAQGRQLQRELDQANEQLREHRDLPPGVRVRRTVIELSRQVRVLRWLLGAYRFVRSAGRTRGHGPTHDDAGGPR